MPRTTDWRGLAGEALGMSIQVRQEAGLGLECPIDVYALCDRLRVPFRFVPISMEGMYRRTPSPYIILSALRPLARRTFSCAHELGHHVFGHGSTVDALLEEHQAGHRQDENRRTSQTRRPTAPNEFLVNAFAGFLLMPSLALRQAYTARRVRPGNATPEQHFAVACSFGVGYTTLINHMGHGARLLPLWDLKTLLTVPRPRIRRALVGEQHAGPSLIVADEHWRLPTLDAEVGNLLLLPRDAEAASETVVPLADTAHGRLFRAERPGLVQIQAARGQWAVFARIARHQYVGLGRYRHFEESAEDAAERAAEFAAELGGELTPERAPLPVGAGANPAGENGEIDD